jgi:hypothetical protein
MVWAGGYREIGCGQGWFFEDITSCHIVSKEIEMLKHDSRRRWLSGICWGCVYIVIADLLWRSANGWPLIYGLLFMVALGVLSGIAMPTIFRIGYSSLVGAFIGLGFTILIDIHEPTYQMLSHLLTQNGPIPMTSGRLMLYLIIALLSTIVTILLLVKRKNKK